MVNLSPIEYLGTEACFDKRNFIYKMIVSVLEAGFLWRVRVLQGPATRHETITSVLSVVQVRSAILWLLRQRLLQCPSHKSRPLALVYLLPHPTTGSISAAQYGTLLGEWSHCTSAARV